MHTSSSSNESSTIHSGYEDAVASHLSDFSITISLEPVTNLEAYTVTVAMYSHQFYWSLVNDYAANHWTDNCHAITQACLLKAITAVASVWHQGLLDAGLTNPLTVTVAYGVNASETVVSSSTGVVGVARFLEMNFFGIPLWLIILGVVIIYFVARPKTIQNYHAGP